MVEKPTTNLKPTVYLEGFPDELAEYAQSLAADFVNLVVHIQPSPGMVYDLVLTDANQRESRFEAHSIAISDPTIRSLGRHGGVHDSERAADSQLLETCARRLLDLARSLISPNHSEIAPLHPPAGKVESLNAILEHCLGHLRRDGEWIGLLLISIDNIAGSSKKSEHQVTLPNEECLQWVEEKIGDSIRGYDFLLRTQAQQFAVIIRGLRADSHIYSIADKILDRLGSPLQLDQGHCRFSASIGSAEYPRDSGDSDTLIRHASVALSKARELGGGRYEDFNAAMGAQLSKRWTLEEQLRSALNKQQFGLEYQPIVHVKSGRLMGIEALVRWDDPIRGRVYPNNFINVLEQTGMIIPVGEWVLYEACRQTSQWAEELGADITLSVNISPKQLDDPGILEKLGRIIRLSGIDASKLYLEITENVLLGNRPEILQTLRDIDALGVKLFIDDFGTGFSSMSYLKRLPIRGLKIDKTFIDGLPDNSSDVAITLSLFELARSMQLQVIAEGVETPAQAQFLDGHDADLVQGYHFSKPLSAELITRLLESNTALPASSAALKTDSEYASGNARKH